MRKEGKKHEEEESCKVRRTCSARSFTKILQQFTATLHLTHLTISQVCDPDSSHVMILATKTEAS